MSHWAEIDENNVVIRVLVGNDALPNEGGDWFVENLGGRWIQTSYNTSQNSHAGGGKPFRGNFASAGYVYDEVNDVFYARKPFDSWLLNETTWTWEAPVPKPNNDDFLSIRWNEEDQEWITIPFPPDDSVEYVWDEETGAWVEA